MPNWVYNQVKLSHKDPAMIERAIKAFKKGEIMQEFHPCPEPLKNTVSGWSSDPTEQKQMEDQQRQNIAEYGYKDWYSWSIDNWGTKWDFGSDSKEVEVDVVHEAIGNDLLPTIDIRFDTAWSPPLKAYQKLESLGFHIHAMYDEESTAFCGEYITGIGENTIEMKFDSEWAQNNVPKHIDEAFGIVKRIKNYEEDE